MNYETKIARDSSVSDYYSEDAAPARDRRRWIIIALAVLVVGLLGLGYYTLMHGGSNPAVVANKQTPKITVIVPGKQVVAAVITSTGSLAARREMPVGVTGEGGTVSRVFVEPGDWVREGQVLASIERSVQAQEANQLRAGISVAQADSRLAQNELDRAKALLSRGFISKAEIDRKSAALDGAIARVRVAQAQLGAASARIGRLDIRAPAGGLVLTRAVEPGQTVSAGSGVLFSVARGGEMELRAQLSEGDLMRLSVGQAASVTPVGTTAAFNGQIWQLSPTIDPASRQGIARIALSYNAALRPGGFASANITTGSADAPLLPESAIQSDAKGRFVFIVGAKNKIERRDVQVGSVTDKGATVLGGLSGQELVVLSAGAFLNPGETVQPVKQAATK
jgi:HlyD family secretion protein